MAATHDRAPRWSQLLQLLAERGRLSVAEVCRRARRVRGHRAPRLQRARRTAARDPHPRRASWPRPWPTTCRPATRAPRRTAPSSRSRPPRRTWSSPGTVVGLNGGTTTSAVARAAGHPARDRRQRRCGRRSRWSPTPSTSRPRWCCARRCAASAWAGWPGPSPTSRPARSRSPPCPSSGSTCSMIGVDGLTAHHRRDLPARRRGEHQRRHGQPGRARGGRDHR